MKKTAITLCICILSAISFFSGCINVPEELTQLSIVSFDVEPGIINQGESANLSWVVISASSVKIDNGIGSVALTGHRIVQPVQTTTYILTASNGTTTKIATVTITVNYESNESNENQEIIISSFEVNPDGINPGESAYLTWVVTGATLVSIDNGIGNVTLAGNKSIWPTETTTYTLTASNVNTSKYANVTIYLPPEQPIQTPNIACAPDYIKNVLTVTSADVDIQWSNINITVVNNTRLTQIFTSPTGSVDAGDILDFSAYITHDREKILVTFKYNPTNSLIGTWIVY
jgi:hypothetical protein